MNFYHPFYGCLEILYQFYNCQSKHPSFWTDAGQWVLVKDPTIKNGHMTKGLVLFCGEEKQLLPTAKRLNLSRGAFYRAGGATEESIYLYM